MQNHDILFLICINCCRLKISSSNAVGIEVSSIDNHSLIGLSFNAILSLIFFCCALWIQYYFSLLSPSIILCKNIFNKNNHKQFYLSSWSISFISASRSSCPNFLITYEENTFVRSLRLILLYYFLSIQYL